MKKRLICILITVSIIVQGLCGISVAADEDVSSKAYFAERRTFYEGLKSGMLEKYPPIISDEEFFGEWDQENSVWIKEPYFNYDKYENLAAVEEAAMKGDYAKAKEQILEYYRKRFKSDMVETTSATMSKENQLEAEATIENFVILSNLWARPIERISVTRTGEWKECDILARLNNAIGAAVNGTSVLNVAILDYKKDGYMGEFSTKEGEYSPYLKVVVNGTTRYIYPNGDATLRAGEYMGTSYGSEPVMLTNESYTSINAEQPIDDYTRQAMVRFSIENISTTDEITEATLYLYGRMTEDDNPIHETEVPRAEKDSIDLLLLDDFSNTVWNEENFSWSNRASDSYFSYDGEFGSYISTPTLASGQWSAGTVAFGYRPLTALYRATKNEEYLYHAIRWMVNSALVLEDDFTRTTQPFFQTAQRIHYFIPELYTTIKSEYMTPDDFTIILKSMYLQVDHLVTGWSSTEEGSNIGAICSFNLLEGAITFREFKRYDDPITELSNPEWGGSMQGGWLAVGNYRIVYKLKETVFEDGSSSEVGLAYVNTNIGNLAAPFSFASRMGVLDEVIAGISPEDRELFQKTLQYVVDLSNPIYGGWQDGDDDLYSKRQLGNVANAARFFNGPTELSEWATSTADPNPKPHPIKDYTSVAYDTVARAVLRSSWDKDAVALYTQADGGVRSHGHKDDCNVGLMAYGTYLLADPLNYSYAGNASIRDWQKSTRAHNTIEINSTNMNNYQGRSNGVHSAFGEDIKYSMTEGTVGSLHPEIREFNDTYDYMRVETNGYIDNSAMDSDYKYWRDILFVKPGYYILTDYIQPEDSTEVNQYRQNWHFMPEFQFEIDEETKNIKTLNTEDANIIIAPVDGSNALTPRRLPGYYAPTGTNTNFVVETEYPIYYKEGSGITTFNTILYPVQSGDYKEIMTQELQLDLPKDKANAFEATITDTESGLKQNISYFTLFDETVEGQQDFGYYSTDATLAFVEETAKSYSTAVLRDGTNIKDSILNRTIVSSAEPMKHLGVEWSQTAITISSSDAENIDLDSLRIYAPKTIGRVWLDGNDIKAYRDGDYVCFKESETTTPLVGTTVDSGSSGGSGGGGGGGNDHANQPTTPVEPEEKPGDIEVVDPKPFDDIENHWAEEYINKAFENKIITGDDDGSFRPDDSISRAELVAIAMRTLSLEEVEYKDDFKDVSKDDWYAGVLAQALELGIISKDENFRPNDAVTREEMCKILMGIAEKLELKAEEEKAFEFADKDSISDWAKEYIGKAYSLGLMNGISETTFGPKETATRAQTVTVISRMLAGKEE